MVIKDIIKKQRDYFNNGRTRDVDFRIEQLRLLKKTIKDNEDKILNALNKDLKKSYFEGYETEVGILLEEIDYTIKKVKSWAKSKRVKTPITHFLSRSYIHPEPYGVVLIMAPWNYPFQLTIAPLIGAIAAGNCSILKPSEYSNYTSEIIYNIIKENFDEGFVAVIKGGREVNEKLLNENFDYIFFTGSIPVGKIVMEAAAKNLTPVTLELGGKSPCIVDKDIDTKLAARRIVWGKFLNAGQTCVAPDYLLVHEDTKDKLIKDMKEIINEFYGDNPKESPDYPRIINKKHLDRLSNLLNSGNILVGGETDKESLYIEPTIIDNVSWEDSVMADEIFGPILPIIEYRNIEEVIEMVNSYYKPLALYLFSNNKLNIDKIKGNIPFGGGCINDTIVHLASPYMPFGGVGSSGMGSYHGKASFDTFSHKKSILKKSNLFDIKLRYPPYKNKLNILKKLMK
ncbi:aldehyde dehydrogenase [Dethiothermospora halolimnae]|uniref:aldehyde dehydrogenase n=1 Tax=Dethiothermospora halolimnae TaxID=3114390 RepID=UPI003CCC34EA